ncbi:MAG: DUF6377 domain-containing protein [Prevotella sp.]|jgi:hypothetical protein
MRQFLIIVLSFLNVVSISSSELETLYTELEKEMNNCDTYIRQRESKINGLKLAARYTQSNDALLNIYDKLFSCYYDYQYDSAMVYTCKELSLARSCHNIRYESLALMHRSLLLSLAGFYSDGQQCFDKVDSIGVPEDLREEYWRTKYTFLSFWYDYYRGSEFKDKLKPDILRSLSFVMKYTPPTSTRHMFYKAIRKQNSGDYQKAADLWRQTMTRLHYGDPLYAQAACNLAVCLGMLGDDEGYETWLIKASIGDIRCATRQEVAMKFLAIYIYNKPQGFVSHAEKLMNFSLHNARAYNSRMRLMGLAREWPAIISAYQQELLSNNNYLRLSLIGLTLLLIAVMGAMYYIKRQNKLLSLSRKELKESYDNLDKLNGDIRLSNSRLLDINAKRETLAKVYIDLCDKYINRFKIFKTLVSRKIKAGQVRDLMSKLSSADLTTEEANEFLNNFDKAFIQLYPSFVTELNKLFRNDVSMSQAKDGHLSTELRIAALIRLGVTDSSEIANLLFYSPQTVYNYRWSLKSKAIRKDSFESDVAQLCRYE